MIRLRPAILYTYKMHCTKLNDYITVVNKSKLIQYNIGSPLLKEQFLFIDTDSRALWLRKHKNKMFCSLYLPTYRISSTYSIITAQIL